MSFKRCIVCGDVVPEARPGSAKTCTPECGERWRLKHRRELYQQAKEVHGMHIYRERNQRRRENCAALDALAERQAARVLEEGARKPVPRASTLAAAESLGRGGNSAALNRENALTGGCGATRQAVSGAGSGWRGE